MWSGESWIDYDHAQAHCSIRGSSFPKQRSNHGFPKTVSNQQHMLLVCQVYTQICILKEFVSSVFYFLNHTFSLRVNLKLVFYLGSGSVVTPTKHTVLFRCHMEARLPRCIESMSLYGALLHLPWKTPSTLLEWPFYPYNTLVKTERESVMMSPFSSWMWEMGSAFAFS